MVKGTEVYGVSIWNVVMYACIEYPYDVDIIFGLYLQHNIHMLYLHYDIYKHKHIQYICTFLYLLYVRYLHARLPYRWSTAHCLFPFHLESLGPEKHHDEQCSMID